MQRGPIFNGIVGQSLRPLSEFPPVDMSAILDGTSNTILAGERGIFTTWWETGGQENGAYRGGFVDGTNRVGYLTRGFGGAVISPIPDKPAPAGADRSTLVLYGHKHFGSAHPDGARFALCDGSVRSIRYSVAPDTFYRVCNRKDGEPLGGEL
jgi:hypothetical protein